MTHIICRYFHKTGALEITDHYSFVITGGTYKQVVSSLVVCRYHSLLVALRSRWNFIAMLLAKGQ